MNEWPEDRAATLRKLYQDGLSCGQIARALSAPGREITRNAVLGKLHRLGLRRKGRPAPPPRVRPKRPRFIGRGLHPSVPPLNEADYAPKIDDDLHVGAVNALGGFTRANQWSAA